MAKHISKEALEEIDKQIEARSAYPTLTVLGNKVLEPRKDLECFPNPAPGHYFTVTLNSEEFTCLCPITGQPDFASIQVQYEPNEWIAESKSFKLYLWSFRDERAFHEKVVNDIADFFMEKVKPVSLQVIGTFNPRGGIGIEVRARRHMFEETLDDFPA